MEIKIEKTASDQRFDRFLRKWFKKYPQVRLADIYSAIRKGLIKVNNKKVKEQYRLIEGDMVSIDESIETGSIDPASSITQNERKLEKVDINKVKQLLLYEDDQRIVFNKPTGIPMHPGNKHRNDPCMNDYLTKYTQELQTKTFAPAFGYRLDRDTSGVLIAAKTYEALQYINTIIRDRQIEKEYLTIVKGKFPKHLLIDKPLTKSYNKQYDRSEVTINYREGVEAKTECRGEKQWKHPLFGDISLLRVKIHTGRMHQIRIHVSDAGFPVLGDIIYGETSTNKLLYTQLGIKRQLLHCRKYSFHDKTKNKKISFEAPLPQDFQKVLESKV